MATYLSNRKQQQIKNMWFERRGTPEDIEEIAAWVDCDPRTVRKILADARLEDSVRPSARKRHIDKLLDFSDEVRRCLYDPRTYLIPDIPGKVHLTIKRQSYILDPITWFYLCTPNLTKESCGKQLLSFSQHIKGSPFFDDYEKLKKAVEKLQFTYERAAETLGLKNRRFKQTWTKIQKSRMVKNLSLRVPGHTKLELDIYPSCSDVHDDLLFLEELQAYVPNVTLQLGELERLLIQLNDDLFQDEIDRLIRRNRCKDCP